MLMAPLMSIIGGLEKGKCLQSANLKIQQTISKIRSSKTDPKDEVSLVPHQPSDYHQSFQLPLSSTRSSRPKDLERPDTCWASRPICLGATTIYICMTLILVGYSILSMRTVDKVGPLSTITIFQSTILLATDYLYFMVLCSFIIELAVPQDRYWLQGLLQFLVIGLFMAGWLVFFFISDLQTLQAEVLNKKELHSLIFAAIGLYILGALIHRAIGWSKQRSTD